MIKRNSIQFRLFDTYSTGCVWDLDHGRVNFCQYSRKVMLGMLNVFVITLVLTFLSIGLLQVLGTVGLWLFTDNPWMPFIGQAFPFGDQIKTGQGDWLTAMGGISWVALIGAFVVSVIVGGCILTDKYNEYRNDHQKTDTVYDTNPSFITMWYRSWKNKFCPIMELEKKDVNESA